MIQKMQKMMSKKNKKGFTLIELIVVIAIIAILAAVLIPRFSGFTDKAKTSAAIVQAKQIATAGDILITEGKTVYTGATPSADVDEFDDADVIKLAGGAADLTGAISAGSVSGGRFLFTYTVTYQGTVLTAVRAATGDISVTYP